MGKNNLLNLEQNDLKEFVEMNVFEIMEKLEDDGLMFDVTYEHKGYSYTLNNSAFQNKLYNIPKKLELKGNRLFLIFNKNTSYLIQPDYLANFVG